MKPYDPIYQLAAREAVRFVGTVADVMTDVCAIYSAVIESFGPREIRSEADLIRVIQQRTEQLHKKACKVVTARHTLEVIAGLRLLIPLPQLRSTNRKYSLGDGGRVVRAMLKHQRWSADRSPSLFIRPMFEFNGDYLLQAMSAADCVRSPEQDELACFTGLVRELSTAKIIELPATRTGVAWQTYVQELNARQAWVGRDQLAEVPTDTPTLDDLKRERANKLASLIRVAKHKGSPVGSAEAKTFQHHFARCRSWLLELGLLTRSGSVSKLTPEGRRILDYFRSQNKNPGPARIPPTAALLKDTFRFNDDEIENAWGVVVDESYWENGLFDLHPFGTYSPTEEEFLSATDWCFEAVRVRQVSEAALSPLRQTLFLSFLWCGKPLRSGQLDVLLRGLIEQFGHIYGLGLNRQGRPAFVFRKKAAPSSQTP